MRGTVAACSPPPTTGGGCLSHGGGRTAALASSLLIGIACGGGGGTPTTAVPQSSDVIGTSAMPETSAVSVCDRTPQVREAILATLSLTDCAAVDETLNWRLSSRWDLREGGLTSLKPGDFSGLSDLQYLSLYNNALKELPEDVFAGLVSLERLSLARNMLTSLPPGLFGVLANCENWI